MSATNEDVPVKSEEVVKEDAASTQEDPKNQSSSTSNLPDPNVAGQMNKEEVPVKEEEGESTNDSKEEPSKEEPSKEEPMKSAELNEGNEDSKQASSDPTIKTTESAVNTDTPSANSVNSNIDQQSKQEESVPALNKQTETIKAGIVIPKGIKSKKPQKPKKAGLRKGKWTVSESIFNFLIKLFFPNNILCMIG